MIRFLEIKGEYLDDTKTFAFYDTITDVVINFEGSYTFDNIETFELFYEPVCGYDKDRLMGLIPDWWKEYEKQKAKHCR